MKIAKVKRHKAFPFPMLALVSFSLPPPNPSPPLMYLFISFYLFITCIYYHLKIKGFREGKKRLSGVPLSVPSSFGEQRTEPPPLLPLGCNSHRYPGPPPSMVSPTSIPVLLPRNKHPTEHES